MYIFFTADSSMHGHSLAMFALFTDIIIINGVNFVVRAEFCEAYIFVNQSLLLEWIAF